MFVEKCENCGKQYLFGNPVTTLGLKRTGKLCLKGGRRGKCRGKLCDTILDWEDSLPVDDLAASEQHSRQADVSVCLGTSLQINPSGNLPAQTVKHGGKLVIINLQKTKHDKKACLVIHGYVDRVVEGLARHLNMTIPPYVPLSPFKDTDAPPVIMAPVKYENTDLANYEEDSKLKKDTLKKSYVDTNPIQSSNVEKPIDMQVQVSESRLEELRSAIKTTEGKLFTVESTQAQLKSSTLSNQLSVNDLYNTFGDSSPVQSKDCSAKLQHEQAEVSEDVKIKHEDLESSVRELQCPAVPMKKTKYNHNAAF
ncbi:Hypothetical predicted protein [Paramuricea clavata]|uniref:protein acetyllysine N-acetyltransferase n=1 Tax=Paramuricea clavata TaxID=317549 RepID=A0A6S7G0C5_PARCT|nr:Hypothetical predicted protein [Paramuricea clavata]